MAIVQADRAHVPVEELRQSLYDLKREQEDEENYHSRLRAKVDKLEASVRQIRDEIQHQMQKKRQEEFREGQESQAKEREREAKVKNQEERIRDHLSEVLYTKPPGDRKVFELDTVQVSFDRKNFRYLLAFRIDETTMIEQLRTNACKYWGLEKDDYILKTMANNKCQEKVQVKACFKQGEIAQLRLERKAWETSEPAEEEKKAIQPKNSKAKKGAGAARSAASTGKHIDKLQKFTDNYAQNIKRMGGVYFLLKLRDSKPTEHNAKIRLRDILLYVCLAVLTFIVYVSRRPEGYNFWFRQSFYEELLREVPFPTNGTQESLLDHVPGFREVRSLGELWQWLEITLPEVIWSNSTRSLGSYNTLLGYMAIRAQNVKEPSGSEETCAGAWNVIQQLGPSAKCYAADVSGQSHAEAEMTGVSQYWAQVTSQSVQDVTDVRGPANPGVFVSAEENGKKHYISPLWGNVVSYDASGYSVNYRMRQADPEKGAEQYKLDMARFKELGWISLATRAVVVSLTAYNFHYDLWISCDLVFELPASGSVSQYAALRPFKQRTSETAEEQNQTYIDYVRIIIAVYILIWVGYQERKHKTKNHKAGIYYYFSLNGITDVLISVCIFTIVIWRYVQFEGESTAWWLNKVQDNSGDMGFLSFSRKSFNYEIIFVLEGILMSALMYRMLSFVRLNRHVYLMWHTLGIALQSLVFFFLLFMPAITAFTFLMNKVFGVHVHNFSLLSLTLLELFNLMSGTADIQGISDVHASWAIFMLITFYIVVTFGLLNACVMAVVDAYYVVHLTQGGPGERWNAKRWKQWALPAIWTHFMNEWGRSRKHHS